MFIDQAKIFIQSGKGGDGVIHFRREKYVPYGGPDGGDGGKGGDVILHVDSRINTLSSFRKKSRFNAQNGSNGAKQNMTGRSGKNLVIPVPAGTIVYDDHTGDVLGDLLQSDHEIIIAKGGRGGRGNVHFATSRNQTPRLAERGEPGRECILRLELKLIADVGIVGVPNAGKSTYLAAVTNALPKIAPYPFTTLEPNLGVAELDMEKTVVLADIPGLIEGASQGLGLGYDFLRHVQRTRVLIHILDGLAEDPVLDYLQINSELAIFDPELSRKPQVVAFNKMDLPDVQVRWQEISQRLQKEFNVKNIYAISAATHKNVREVLYHAARLVDETTALPELPLLPVYRLIDDHRKFEISRIDRGWRVIGAGIERAAAMTYWNHHQSIRRFQRILKVLGIDQALREAGIQNGDMVYIGEYELEWTD